MTGRVARRRHDPYARPRLGLSVDLLERRARKVRHVGQVGVVVLFARVGDLALLHEDRRPREMAVASRVIGVEVAVGDELDVGDAVARGAKRFLDRLDTRVDHRPAHTTRVNDLAGFVALAIVVIVTPGPDTALTIRNALVGGRPAGIATAIGVALGQATWSVATSIGVAALLVAAEPAFAALKLAGAAYLIYLGAQSLWSAFRGRPAHPALDGPVARVRTSTALRQGVLSNLM